MLKVVHIASGDHWGGAEAQVHTLLVALQKQAGFSVHAIILNRGELAKRLQESAISTTILDEEKLNSLQILFQLRQLFSELRPDIVHSHRQKENVLSAIANFLSIRAPILNTAHGANEHFPPIWKLHKNVLRWLNWFCCRFLHHRIIAVSKDLAGKLEPFYPSHQLTVIENGLDIGATLLAAEGNGFRSDYPEGIHIGIVGRLAPVKRVDLFLQIAALLITDTVPTGKVSTNNVSTNNEPQNWFFHIFGDGPLASALTQQAKDLNIGSRITFHGHRNDIARCIKDLDLLVMCSDHEGLPMTPLESITLDTPVIAHKTGGLIDILDNHCGGLLVSNHHAEGYTEAIQSLIDPNTDTKQLLSQGKSRVEQQFSAKVNADKITKLYKQLAQPALTSDG